MSRVIQMSRVLFCMSANLNTLLPFRNYCVCGNDTAKENDHEHTEALKSNDRSTDLWATVLPETNSFLTSMNHQNSMTVSKLFDIPSAIRSLLCPEPTNGRRHGICQVSWSTTSSALWRRYLPKVAEEVGGLLCSSVLTTPPVLRWIDRVIWSLKSIFMPIGTIVVGYILKVTSIQKRGSQSLFPSFYIFSRIICGELLHSLPGAKLNSQPVLKAQYRTCAEVPSRHKDCLASGVKT